MADFEIFRDQLTATYPTDGHPLWMPNPPRPDRPVEIGDVGFLRKGKFHSLFNALLPADDPSQEHGVPEYHEQLVPSLVNHISKDSLSCRHYCSAGVSVETESEVRSFSPDDSGQTSFVCPGKRTGAVLYLPAGVRREDTLAKGDFGRWMLKHIDRWFAFAKGLGLGIEQMEELILVTGCDRTKSWMNIAFLGNQVDARVSFGVDVNDASINFQHSPKHVRGAMLNKGPTGKDLPENQCVFIRGFRVARTLKILPKHLKAAADPPQDSDGNDYEPERELISIPAATTQRDPLHLAQDYIAERASDCDMVLIHDDDLGTIEGIGNGTPPETLQPDVMMDLLRRSNVEIQKVLCHRPNTVADSVKVAMLPSTFRNWNIAPQSRLSPLAAQNIRHGHTSEPSQSSPLISDNSPASAIRNGIRKHKGFPIEDYAVSMPGQGPLRRREVATRRRDTSHISQWIQNSREGPGRGNRCYPPQGITAQPNHQVDHTVAPLAVPPPFFSVPNVAGQSPIGGRYSWDIRQHYSRLDGASHPSLGAGHGHPFSPVPVRLPRHTGTWHGAPTQLPRGPLLSSFGRLLNVLYPDLYDAVVDGDGLVHEQNQITPLSQFRGYPSVHSVPESPGLPMSRAFPILAVHSTTLTPPTDPRPLLQPNHMYSYVACSGDHHMRISGPIARAGPQDEGPAQAQNAGGFDLTKRTSVEPPTSSFPQLPGPQLRSGLTSEWYGPQMPASQPSSPRIRKRALIIGIDYTSHPDPDLRLKWCTEDAFTMANFLCDKLGFKRDDIRIITDKNPWDLPTKEIILDAMRALVRDAKPHDSFFFYFSGHSTQINDMDVDEQYDLDECSLVSVHEMALKNGISPGICAMDWRGNEQPPYEDTPGLITDDVMHDILVKPLPMQCRLTAVFDACHSGTVFGLPYVYSPKGVIKEVKHQNKSGLLWEGANYADVVSLCASQDSRKARETRKGGVLRSAFINCFATFQYNVTYKQLIENVYEYMRNHKCKQKLVLSSSRKIDSDCRFIV